MDETRLINDVVETHQERMTHLKRYYPFFRLMDLRLSQYKAGQYASVDMGYVVMAVLRFFIEYNHFQDLPVSYGDYEAFMRRLLARDFGLTPDEKEDGEMIQMIFDRLTNDGRPFIIHYFDPAARAQRVMHVRLIESTLRHMQVVYRISADAVAFYLDTKEMHEESRISIAQLLLTKKIKSRDFKGGMQVLDSINLEVVRLLDEQDEIKALLGRDPIEGLKALEKYHETLLNWFEDEQRLFASNMALTRQLAGSADGEPLAPDALKQLRDLDLALKNATERHSQLMQAYLQMGQAGEAALRSAKRSRFRQSVDFVDLLSRIMQTDRGALLIPVIEPLFKPRIVKRLNLSRMDDLLEMKSEDEEAGEKIIGYEQEELPDPEKETQERIDHNFALFTGLLEEMLEKAPSVTLRQFNDLLTERFSEKVLKNADYYAFLVHLCRKETGLLAGDGRPAFRLSFGEGERISLPGGGSVTDIHFERTEDDGTQES